MADFAAHPVTLDELLATQPADTPLMATPEWDGVVTVGEMRALAGAAAAYLAQQGIGPGDRVAVWGQNSVAWAMWLCAAAWRGAAVVALHPMLGPDDLRQMLTQCKPVWLIADEMARGRSLADIARDVAPKVSGLRGVTVMPGADGAFDLSGIIDRTVTTPARLGQLDAPLNLQFTSGSTGKPKIVVLSHRALVINAVETARASGIVAGDHLASPMPFVHAAGLSSGFILALATGALWCTSHRFRPDVLLAQIHQHQCTVMQGVPTMFKGLVDHMDKTGADTPSLRLGFIGGAPCPPDLCRRSIDRMGLQHMAIVYGQTEFGPTISLTTGAEPADLALTSAGPVLPGAEAKLVDGEIWVRGRTLMNGYFENGEANTAAITADGWLRTGDLGRIDRGCLQITARLKELIIRGGENVSPYEVEDALRDAPGVADIVAVPLPSAHWGEEICAVLLGTPDLDAVRALAEQRLARFRRPDKYIVRAEFPALPSGKVDRVAIKRAVNAGEWT